MMGMIVGRRCGPDREHLMTASSETSRPSLARSSTSRIRKRILVVDDEQDLLDLVTYNLQRSDFDVLTARDGNEAIQIASTELPHLILLDLMLPGIDGTEVA